MPSDTAERSPLGARVRTARMARGLSVRGVARSLGVSPSLISQIENGRTQPSVSTLYALAAHLKVSVDILLGFTALPSDTSVEPKSDGQLVEIRRAASSPEIVFDDGVVWRHLAAGAQTGVEALLVTYPPGASSSSDGSPTHHTGLEHVYILEGSLRVDVHRHALTLASGDSLQFESTLPHRYANQTSKPVTGIWYVVRGSAAGLSNEPPAF